ncbi:MAG: cytochrome c3 family protein [Coriobacteriia bacterium]|nr:cytochrome c3 family protein [Coriobacteriia bacterium]
MPNSTSFYEVTETYTGSTWTRQNILDMQLTFLFNKISSGSASTIYLSKATVTLTYTIPSPSTIVTFTNPTRPAGTTVARSQSLVVDRFTMQRTDGVGASAITSVTVCNSGTTPASTVSGVDIWRDDGDGTLGAGDVKLNATPATFSGTDAVVTFTSPETVDDTQGYLVVYTVAANATHGATLRSQVTSAAGTGFDTLSGLPLAVGNVFTVSVPTTVTFSSLTKPVARAVPGGTTGVVVDRFRAARTVGGQGSAITSITVRSSGTTPTSVISGVDIWRDVNVNSTLETGTDIKLNGTVATFSGTDAVVSMNETLCNLSEGYDYLVVYAVSGAASNDATFNAQVIGAAGTAYDTFAGLPLPAGEVFSVGNPTLEVTHGPDAPTGLTYVRPGATNVVIDQIRFSASRDAVRVTSITITGRDTHSSLTTDVVGVKLFVDNGDHAFNPASDTQLGTTMTFDGNVSGTGKAIFSGLSLTVDQDGSADVWVVYDLAATLPHGRGIGSQLNSNGVVVAAPAVVTSFSALISGNGGVTIAVDNVPPSASECSVENPVDGSTLALAAGTQYLVTGTAGDGSTVVANVRVSIKRDTVAPAWWNGVSWQAGEFWLPASDTAVSPALPWSTWDPLWIIPSADGTTFVITLVVTDEAGNVLSQKSEVVVDNVKPTVQSVVADTDSTHVDVIFSENLDPSTVQASDFSIAGLDVSSCTTPDARTVRLVTSTQGSAGTEYALTIAAGNVADTIGNTNDLITETFWSYGTPDTIPPPIPVGVAAVAGSAEPTIAVVTWTASVGASGYNIWRAVNPAGPFSYVGTAAGTSFDDITGVPGQDYYYRVSAFDAVGNESAQSAVVGPVAAIWTRLPHGSYTDVSSLCGYCHAVHQAAAPQLLRDTGETPREISVCFACHDGSGASTNIATGGNSFSTSLPSGHTLDEDPAKLAATCSDCHSPHSDPDDRPMLPAKQANETTVTAAGIEWCVACHNDDHDWYTGVYTYDATLTAEPARDDTGYPIVGTFAGASVYTSPTANAHLGIPASSGETTRVAGDCLYCHASHRGANGYDGLKLTFRPTTASTLATDQSQGTYAESCFYCHGGVLPSELTTLPTDIKQFVTTGGSRSGHRIVSADASLPVGAPLPCYDCHNPHGSSRGNATLLSDGLGTGLSTATDADIRKFCFTCHTTYDNFSGWTASGWQVIPASETVEGIGRRSGVLGLPNASGHDSVDSESCYLCHGSSYATGGANVHNPTGGVSAGGTSCLGCHSVYSGMVESTSTYHHVLDASVPDIAPADGSYPTSMSALACVSCHVDHNYFNSSKSSNLRRSITETSGANSVATDYIAVGEPGAPGICMSCHRYELARNNAGQKLPTNPSTHIRPIDIGQYDTSPHSYVATSTYGDGTLFLADCAKCHNDTATKVMQTSTDKFGVHESCDRRILGALGVTSYSEELATRASELCYRCHSYATDAIGGDRGAKTVGHDSYDWYGTVTTMSVGNLAVFRQFQYLVSSPATASGHPEDLVGVHLVSPADEDQAYISANKHVECADCHNPHAVGDVRHGFGTTNLVSESIRGVSGSQVNTTTSNWTTAGVTFTWTVNAEREYEICFKCHARVNTGMYDVNLWNEQTWTDVALEFNPGNQSYHPVVQALPAIDPSATWGSSRVYAGQVSGGWIPGNTMYCSDCHGDSAVGTAGGPHGSTVKYILKAHTDTVAALGPRVYWPNRPNGTAYTISNVQSDYTTYGDTQCFCSNCHEKIRSNIIHDSGSTHDDAPCTDCHTLVPHGGKVSRLIATYNSATPNAMPARYAVGGVRSNVKIESFRKKSDPSSYVKADCNISCGGSAHAADNTGKEFW